MALTGNEPISTDNLKAVVSSIGGGVIHGSQFDLYGNNEKKLQNSIDGYDLIVVVFEQYSTVIAKSNDGYAYGTCIKPDNTAHLDFKIKGNVFYGNNSSEYLNVQKIFGVKVKMN